MKQMKNYLKMVLFPLLIVLVISSCDDRDGITFPTITIAPTVSSTFPINNATSVPFNQKISVNFSVVMDVSTIATSTFRLMHGTTPVDGFVSYSGVTAIFSPASNLSANTIYTATITTGSKNMDGTALEKNYVWNFTTGSEISITLPEVISTDPVNSGTAVPINQKVAATFSMAMDASTITASTFTVYAGTTPVSGFVSYSGTTAIFAPETNLLPNTLYTGTITTSSKNLLGYGLAQNYVWSFTTGSTVVTTLPTVISTDPVNGATAVALNKQVSATFSKTMDAMTITTATFTLMQGSTFVSGTVHNNGATATYVPSSNLASNTTYTATITTGAKDLAGNSLANNYVWSFRTGDKFAVTLSSDPLLGGSTSGGGTFDSGASVTVTATANTGYTFTNWTENGTEVSANPTYQFTINGNRTLVANFAVSTSQFTVSLSSNPSAGGSTSGEGTFNSGVSVIVTATANAGYIFTNWTENGTEVSTNPTYQFTLTKNRTLVANFAASTSQFTVSLSSNPSAGGVTSGSGTFDSGASVIVTATANTGYTFTNWTENGTEVSTNPTYQFTLTKNRTLVANFAASTSQFTVSLSSNPSAGGVTSGSGTFDSGASVIVTATANTGYTFTNWTENGTEVSTNPTYQFTLTKNRALVANFAASTSQYTVSLSSDPSAGGSTSGGGTFDSGASVTVTATANMGYTFTNWTENGTEVSTNTNYQFTLTKNTTLVANFAADVSQYTVSLSSDPLVGGSTSGDGTFDSGDLVTVVATANAGYVFTNWTENGSEVSTNSNYQFTLTNNTTLVANFTLSGGQLPIDLGSVSRFAILSNSAISNIPTSAITGDVGISPGARSAITGFVLTPDASNTFATTPEVTGKVFSGDDDAPTPAMLINAKIDAENAYLSGVASTRGTPTPISGNINGLTLVPGLYESGTSIEISPGGFLYLDGQGDGNSVFIIRSATSITTSGTSEVVLTNGANAKNIFWVAGSAITLGTNSKMKGTLIASTSISLLTGARLDGRAIIQSAAAGQVSLDQATIVIPN